VRDFIISRLIQTLFSILIVTVIAFLLVHMIPGDPVIAIVGSESSVEEIQRLRHEMGLDRPLIVQYGRWINGVLHGELGTSRRRHEKVISMIARSAPISFLLVGLGLLAGAIVGIPAGIISAIRRGRLIDSLVTMFSNLGVAMPVFWLGILLIYFFGLKLGLLQSPGTHHRSTICG